MHSPEWIVLNVKAASIAYFKVHPIKRLYSLIYSDFQSWTIIIYVLGLGHGESYRTIT
jgi:hypothetical protein